MEIPVFKGILVIEEILVFKVPLGIKETLVSRVLLGIKETLAFKGIVVLQGNVVTQEFPIQVPVEPLGSAETRELPLLDLGVILESAEIQVLLRPVHVETLETGVTLVSRVLVGLVVSEDPQGLVVVRVCSLF